MYPYALLQSGLSGICLLLCITVAHAQTRVQSLGEARNVLMTTETRMLWDNEMNGSDAGDPLGTQLPSGLSRDTIISALVADVAADRILLVGAKPWPQRSGEYVAIVCLSDSSVSGPRDGQCTGSPTIFLGVFGPDANGQPALLASGGPLEFADDPGWGAVIQDPASATPETWDRFDLAPYQLAPDRYAFGLRGSQTRGYAGGGAVESALYLFEPQDGRLRPVFAAIMDWYENIAGEWHADGTREHDVDQGSNVLIVLPTRTSGYNDLLLRNRRSRDSVRYIWSENRERYQHADG